MYAITGYLYKNDKCILRGMYEDLENFVEELKECINDFPVIHYSSIEKVDNKRLSGKLIPIDDLLDILQEVK